MFDANMRRETSGCSSSGKMILNYWNTGAMEAHFLYENEVRQVEIQLIRVIASRQGRLEAEHLDNGGNKSGGGKVVIVGGHGVVLVHRFSWRIWMCTIHREINRIRAGTITGLCIYVSWPPSWSKKFNVKPSFYCIKILAISLPDKGGDCSEQ